MSTITTKQLRQNMAQIIDDLRKGKSVQLSYRHKIIGTLQPVAGSTKPLRRGSPEAILNSLQSVKLGPAAAELKHSNKSFKEEIRELRERDLA